MSEETLRAWVIVWFVAALFILVRHWRGAAAGLVFTYVLMLAAIHWLAPLMYLLPWYTNVRYDLTAEGLRQSTFAILGFTAGSEVMLAISKRRHFGVYTVSTREGTPVDPRIVNLYLLAGIFLYGFVAPLAGRVPSATALVSTGATLAVVAIGLKCWNSWTRNTPAVLWTWLGATMMLPIVTVLGQGFLGYGFAAMASVFAFVASFFRPRWKVVVLATALGYLGLSVYVNYMRDRREIRAVVWSGASFQTRVDQLTETFANAEWFTTENVDHLNLIDSRLNQDYLIGAAVEYIGSGFAEHARGTTFWDAAAAVIPRALWPNKPVVGGSGDLVSTYTGIRFADGTSVGIGQVLESFVNFGSTGVAICFVVLGAILTWIDRSALDRLRVGDANGFLIWYLPGLSLLQVGGSFMEVTSTAGAGLVVAIVLNRLAGYLPYRGHDLASSASPVTPEAKGSGVSL
ncbi:MAG TPA: hypothetical protein VH679_00055 [Vicinamibacterales bacterium]